MKKIIVLGLVVLMGAGVAWAQVETKVLKSQQRTVAPSLTMEDAITESKASLNGTEWVIALTPMGTGSKSKGKGEQDVITFMDDQVRSKNLSDLGYPATNFSVRLEDDGTVIWETMQTLEKVGTAFWRGDITADGVMRGVLSKRDTRGNVIDYDFISVSKN